MKIILCCGNFSSCQSIHYCLRVQKALCLSWVLQTELQQVSRPLLIMCCNCAMFVICCVLLSVMCAVCQSCCELVVMYICIWSTVYWCTHNCVIKLHEWQSLSVACFLICAQGVAGIIQMSSGVRCNMETDLDYYHCFHSRLGCDRSQRRTFGNCLCIFLQAGWMLFLPPNQSTEATIYSDLNACCTRHPFGSSYDE